MQDVVRAAQAHLRLEFPLQNALEVWTSQYAYAVWRTSTLPHASLKGFHMLHCQA